MRTCVCVRVFVCVDLRKDTMSLKANVHVKGDIIMIMVFVLGKMSISMSISLEEWLDPPLLGTV